ncbi:MAG: lipoprotein insertase outer membrane protein LolB [Gammaproteobacteria bacterium]
MTGRRLALASVAALALAVAGCASVHAPQGAAEPASGGGLAMQPEATRWSGRFAVTMTEPGVERHEERASGRFTLETRGKVTLLELATPLGQTMASASLDDGLASLVTSEGRRYEAASAEELTEQVFGWRVPVGDLPRWLRGHLERPDESADGHPISGQGHGWSVRLEDWRRRGPARLTLEWPGRPQPEARRVNLKLIVDDVS